MSSRTPANLAEETAQVLVGSALTVLSDAIKERLEQGPARQTISDKRLQDVLMFVESHISDPNLSIAAIAKGCGISPRYLSALFKRYKTSYAKLVWDKRLKIASEWLAQSKAGEVVIREIAYRVGFKSPEHFSRRFKRAYNLSPCDYRAASVLGKTGGNQKMLAGVTTALR